MQNNFPEEGGFAAESGHAAQENSPSGRSSGAEESVDLSNNFPADEGSVRPQPFAPVSREEMEQFEQFKKIKLLEQTRARIKKVECDCLSPAVSKSELKNLCREGERLGLGGIVVLPAFVRACVAYLGNDPTCSLIAPVSYPHGGDSTESKLAATKRAVKDGVDEVEVYAPFAAIKEGNMAYVKREFKKLVKKARPRALRIVLDCDYLDEREVIRACNCAADCGVNVIRLVHSGGLSAITSAKSALRDRCLIKADAITLADMEEVEALGASIINCDNAVELCSRLLNAAQAS